MRISDFARGITPLFLACMAMPACATADPSPAEGDVAEAAAALAPYSTFQIGRADGTTRQLNIPAADLASSLAFKAAPYVAGGATTTDAKALLAAAKSVVGAGGAQIVVTRSGRSLSATPRPGLARKISWDEDMTRIEFETGSSTSLVFFEPTLEANPRATLLGQLARSWLEGFDTGDDPDEPHVNPGAWVPASVLFALIATQAACCPVAQALCAFQCTHGATFECDGNLGIASGGTFKVGLGCDIKCDCHNPYGPDTGTSGGEAELVTPNG